MPKLVSEQLQAMRRKFRQFEHGGHCFDSDDISGIVAEVTAIISAAQALEDRVAADRRAQAPASSPRPVPPRPPVAPRPGAVPIGTIFFVPSGAAQ